MKKRALCVALATAMGAAGSAHAVNVNSDGLGEVLLFPFYTVEAGVTNINIVNTSNSEVKAVKVRFLEAVNSWEVLDFNLYLSPNDVWTGSISATAGGAELTTADNSCTVPAIPAGGVDFRTTQINDDLSFFQSPDEILGRTREGYVEIIEMGVVSNTGSNGDAATAATHVAGIPEDCDQLVSNWQGSGAWVVSSSDGLSEPTGGLFGNASIVDVDEGTAYTYEATALDSFSDFQLHTNPGSVFPSLTDASPQESVVFFEGEAIESSWISGEDAVSAVIMHQSVMNEFGLDSFTDAGTDIVVTFPTKRFYVNGGSPVPPFTEVFTDIGACETIAIDLYDREERGLSPDEVQFSPSVGPTGFALCWEANVITVDSSDVLEPLNTRQDLDGNNFENGWVRMVFNDIGQQMTSIEGPTDDDDGQNTYFGLPAIGFAVQQHLNNGASTAFAGLWDNRYTKNITSSGAAAGF